MARGLRLCAGTIAAAFAVGLLAGPAEAAKNKLALAPVFFKGSDPTPKQTILKSGGLLLKARCDEGITSVFA